MRGEASEEWDSEEGRRALKIRARNEIYNTKRAGAGPLPKWEGVVG